MTFKEAIDQRNFEHALDMITNGEDILKSQWQFKLSDAFANIIRNKAFDVLEALLDNDHIELDLFEYDNFNNTIFLELAKEGKQAETLDFLQNNISKFENLDESLEDKTWIHLAIEHGASVEFIDCLGNNDVEINYRNKAESTYLHSILSNNNFLMKPELKLEYLPYFMDQGIDINALDIVGNTALHIAVEKSEECCDFLIEQGADPNIPNKKGETPYFLALINQGNTNLVLKMNEQYPIDFEVETGKKTSLLFDYLKTIFSELNEDSKNVIRLFADIGFDVFTPETSMYGDETSVMEFVMTKNADWLQTFLDIFDVDVNTTDNLGNSLLHKVCGIGLNFDQAKAKDLYRKVKLLIKSGADVHLTNTQDKKAVDLATDDNLKEKTVALLLKQ